jgi:hypothetical protein
MLLTCCQCVANVSLMCCYCVANVLLMSDMRCQLPKIVNELRNLLSLT